MNKEEILKEIKKTKQHLTDLEEILTECKYERWKPRDNEELYYVNTYLEIIYDYFYSGRDLDRLNYKNYNCFQTYKQAKAEAEKILVRRRLEDIARRLNKGEEPNWDNYEQPKYCISLYHDGIILDTHFSFKTQGAVFCLDENFKDVAFKEIGEEPLKKYLRGG